MGLRWAQKGAPNNGNILQDKSWSPLGPILGHFKPSKTKICLNMPSWTPPKGPSRAQDSPRLVPHGPKTGHRTSGKSRQDSSGGPLRSVLGPILNVLGSTWSFPTNLETNMTSPLFLECLQCQNKAFQQLCCKTAKAS